MRASAGQSGGRGCSQPRSRSDTRFEQPSVWEKCARQQLLRRFVHPRLSLTHWRANRDSTEFEKHHQPRKGLKGRDIHAPVREYVDANLSRPVGAWGTIDWALEIPGLRCAPTWAIESRPVGAQDGTRNSRTFGSRRASDGDGRNAAGEETTRIGRADEGILAALRFPSRQLRCRSGFDGATDGSAVVLARSTIRRRQSRRLGKSVPRQQLLRRLVPPSLSLRLAPRDAKCCSAWLLREEHGTGHE